MVDAPRPEPSLRDLESAPFAQQDVRHGHAHVVEGDFGVTVGRIAVAQDIKIAKDGDARGVLGDDDQRLAQVPGRIVGIGLTFCRRCGQV